MLVFLTAVPAFVLIVYSGWQQRSLAIERVEQRTLNNVNNAAALIEQLIAGVRETFISVPEDIADRRNRPLFSPELKRIVDILPQYTTVGILDAKGNLLASSSPEAGPMSFADRTWFKDLLLSRKFTISEFQVGRITGKKVIVSAYPTLDAQGKVHHVLFLGLDLDWLNSQLSNFEIPEGSSLLVIDKEGTILSRKPGEAISAGEKLSEVDIVKAIKNREKGTAKLAGLDGVTRIYSFTPVPGTNQTIFVAVGIPEKVAFAEVEEILIRNIFLLFFSTALMSVMAWLGSGFVVTRRIQALTDATERMAEGDLSARVDLHGSDEMAKLGASFNAMAESLQLQTAWRTRIEKELRESEERLRKIASTAPDAVILMDNDGNVSFWNEAASNMFGYTSEDVSGKDLHSCLMPDRHMDAFEKGFETFRKTGEGPIVGKVYEIEAKRKDGTEFPVELSLSSVKLNGKWNAVGIVRDITERKRLEESLRNSYNLTNTIIDSMQDAISLINVSDFTIVRANKVFLDEYGYSGSPEITGKHCYEITHKRSEVCEAPNDVCPLSETVRTGEHFSVEHVHYGSHGEKRFVEVSTSPIKDESGAVAQVVHVQRDISERKRAEEEREQLITELKRSNRELEQFAYVASHDLQEPLRMVSSYTMLLKKKYQGQLDDKADRFIHFAVDGADRMQKLIEGLLSYSRITRRGGEFRQINLNDVFSTALSNLAVAIRESHADVSKEELPTIRGDETQLVQLFQNLIGNAIKYRKKDVPPRVNVRAKREKINYVFSIEDNGIGIDPAYFERIFQIFQRLHSREEYSGTGIGLALCKRIVERHRGRIWVESVPGRGSTFVFMIPV